MKFFLAIVVCCILTLEVAGYQWYSSVGYHPYGGYHPYSGYNQYGYNQYGGNYDFNYGLNYGHGAQQNYVSYNPFQLNSVLYAGQGYYGPSYSSYQSKYSIKF